MTQDGVKALLTELRDVFEKWNAALDAFGEEEINRVPFEGSWTPGQVAEHIIKSVSALPDRHTEATQRPYDEYVTPIAEIFLNFSIKLQSPDFVLPGPGPQDKKELQKTFEGIQGRHENAVRTTDLTATCLDFELPTIGLLTRYEWIKFYLVHMQRHTWQLSKIRESMRG